MKHFMFAAGLLALLLNACGSPAVATIDPAQVKASAIAAAATIVASTRAAIPTETPSPLPTETPLPSPTSLFPPTLDPLAGFAPTATSQGGEGTCAHALDVGGAGRTHQTLIKNETTGVVNLSLSLYKVNTFGQCGYLYYGNLHKNSSVMAQLPAGYWSAYAWATTKNKNFTAGGSFFVQPAQFDKLELCVRTERIVYSPQC